MDDSSQGSTARQTRPCPACGREIAAKHVCPECGSWISFRNPTGFFAKGFVALCASLILPAGIFYLGVEFKNQQQTQAESRRRAERQQDVLRSLADDMDAVMTTAVSFHEALHDIKHACRQHGNGAATTRDPAATDRAFPHGDVPDADTGNNALVDNCSADFISALTRLDREVNQLTWKLHSLPISHVTRRLRIQLEERYWTECEDHCDIRQRMLHHLDCSDKSYDGTSRSKRQGQCAAPELTAEHPALKYCASRPRDDAPCKEAHRIFQSDVIKDLRMLKNTLLCSVVDDIHELRVEAYDVHDPGEDPGVHEMLASRWKKNLNGSHCEQRLRPKILRERYGIRVARR